MDPLSIAGLGMGLVGTIGKIFGAGSANRRLQQLLGQDPAYTANPLAAKQLGLASTLLNARMPGATSMERNIYGNQANTFSNINRNATSSSQALALAGGVQGQTNQAFDQLGQQEAQDYQRRYGNYAGANAQEIGEGDKVYQDQVRRFNDKAAIQGAQTQNSANAWQGLSNFGYGALNLGLAGGFKKMFGGSGAGGSTGVSGMPMGGMGGYDPSLYEWGVPSGGYGYGTLSY